jgi:hypothetical protein
MAYTSSILGRYSEETERFIIKWKRPVQAMPELSFRYAIKTLYYLHIIKISHIGILRWNQKYRTKRILAPRESGFRNQCD